jgi:AbrB family looped-hinge helix DNA binding protein
MKLGGHAAPKFYGATKVGERGQVVIPAEARRDLNLTTSDKLLVFGGHEGSIMITKAETFSALMQKFAGQMSHFEEILNTEVESQPESEDGC